MAKCPLCGENIYWVIVKGQVFAIPFSYTDVKSEKAEILKYNEIKEVRCPKCFGKLAINNFEELVFFFEEIIPSEEYTSIHLNSQYDKKAY